MRCCSYTDHVISIFYVHVYVHDDLRWKERKKERKTGTWGQWKNEKWVALRWHLNPQHSALQTDALTNWATKAAKPAGSKSNISYTRLTETWYIHVCTCGKSRFWLSIFPSFLILLFKFSIVTTPLTLSLLLIAYTKFSNF